MYVSRCQIGENDALVSSTLNGDTLAVDPSLVMQRSRVTLLDHDMIRYKDNRLQVNMIVADTTFSETVPLSAFARRIFSFKARDGFVE